MEKDGKKVVKSAKKVQKSRKIGKNLGNPRLNESLDCLVELHKLQGVLLEKMRKDNR